jgi:hypothetical protein
MEVWMQVKGMTEPMMFDSIYDAVKAMIWAASEKRAVSIQLDGRQKEGPST